mgnify:FL=1
MKLKLHAGAGAWYALFNNGTMHYEGNRDNMTDYLKKHTNYSIDKINTLLNQSLTDWLEVIINENNSKLRTVLKEEIEKIIKENKPRIPDDQLLDWLKAKNKEIRELNKKYGL